MPPVSCFSTVGFWCIKRVSYKKKKIDACLCIFSISNFGPVFTAWSPFLFTSGIWLLLKKLQSKKKAAQAKKKKKRRLFTCFFVAHRWSGIMDSDWGWITVTQTKQSKGHSGKRPCVLSDTGRAPVLQCVIALMYTQSDMPQSDKYTSTENSQNTEKHKTVRGITGTQGRKLT